MLRKVPLIVILGSTGTGKTKLSLELAKRFGGEIISADSMQVYADLNIVTAKATLQEQALAQHHLLDISQPSEPFSVVQFRDAALPIIDDLLKKSKCPIVVGGTNYYIESLLWEILVNTPPLPPEKSSNYEELNTADIDSIKLYEKLKEVDPVTAERIHPNNRRKILRALEVYEQTGVTLSTIFNQQRSAPGGNRLGGPLRYPYTILLWLRCNQELLNQRLDTRVDNMLEQGVLGEVRSFYEKHVKFQNSEYTKGVLQSIGFKEFVPYLENFTLQHDSDIEKYLKENSYQLPSPSIVGTSSNKPDDGIDILRKCLNELKLVTKRYSKKQIKWINNRLLASKDRQVPPIYELDTSNINLWDANVFLPAVDVIDSYIHDKVPKLPPMEKRLHPASNLNEEVSNYCDLCKRHFIGEFQWKLHLKSNKHKKVKEGSRKGKQKSCKSTEKL